MLPSPQVCEKQAARFQATFDAAGKDGEGEAAFKDAYDAVSECVDNFKLNASLALRDPEKKA